MTPEEHQQRHIELHKALDELVADFIAHTETGPTLRRPIIDLIEWSARQTRNPDELK